jgi:hypothetical protein
MLKHIAVVLIAAHLSACAHVPVNCDDACAAEGMLCKGRTIGTSSGLGVATYSHAGIACERPETDAEKKQLEDVQRRIAEAKVENTQKEGSIWVKIGIGVAVGLLLLIGVGNAIKNN